MAPIFNKTTYQKGQDCRYNLDKLPLQDEALRHQVELQARSVACLVNQRSLIPENGTYSISPHVPTLAQKLAEDFSAEFENIKPLQSEYENAFAEELSLGEGTAFLVRKQLAITAAHCVCDPLGNLLINKIKTLFLLFGFRKTADGIPKSFDAKDVYKIASVWHYKLDQDNDWAVLRLNREVIDREPLILSSAPPLLDAPLYMLGHPSGLPLKFTTSGTLQKNEHQFFFETNLDAFAGNSGSPVFELATQKTIGILLQGNQDYVSIPQGPNKQVIQPHYVSPKEIRRREGMETYVYEKCHKIAAIGFLKTVFSSSFNMAHIHFSGREDYLTAIKESLVQHVVVLFGPGGIGKSELATAFANQHISDYDFIWQISFESEGTQLLGYQKLAKRLEVPIEEKETLLNLRAKVHRRLEASRNWLLLLDNLEEPIPLPKQGGSVLITSRTKLEVSEAKHLQVDTFTTEEALVFLTQFTGRSHEDWQRLIDQVGCYPLVLSQVASVIHAQGISVENYLLQYQQFHGMHKLEKVLRLTIDQLPSNAQNALYICAFLNPALIPASYLGDGSVEILDALQKHALLRPSNENNLFSIHVEIQKVLARLAPPETVFKVLAMLTRLSQEWDLENTAQWTEVLAKATFWASHGEYFLQATKVSDNLDSGDLLEKLGTWSHHVGRYSSALAYYERALKIHQEELKDEPRIASSLNSVGCTLENLGRYQEALKYKMQALELRQKALGPDHPDVASSLYNVGNTLRDLGQYQEALEYYRDALVIRQKTLKPDDPIVKQTEDNIKTCEQKLKKCEIS